MNVSLVMFKADGSRRDFPVTKPRIVVGRTNDCDLRIPLSSVSRQHCEFRLENDQFKLHDLGSSNGTFRNNTRISQETLLEPGDEVVIGPVVFTVVVDGKPDTIDPVRTVLDRNKAAVNGGSSVAAAAAAVEPQRLSFDTGVSMPAVEDETYSPTVDLDEPGDMQNDDPIAALEALAAGTNDHATPDPEEAPAAEASVDEASVTPEASVSVDDEEDVLIPIDDGDDVLMPLDDDDDEVMPVLDEEDEDLPMLADDDDDELRP